MRPSRGPAPRPMLAVAMRLLIMGWYVVLSLLGGIWAGNWLDQQVGTTPLFLLLGLGLGLTVCVFGLYKMLLPLLGGKQDEDT